ncbi:methyltransferase domain-containing protein [Ottowia sp.]|uniref:methyltransferase domain-containing protein n=1 Tax=Ottowia sp. TaxID=1898956 RepID=UPI003A8B360E
MSTPHIPNDAFTRELQRIRHLIGEGILPMAAKALNAAQQQAPSDPRVPLLGMRLAEKTGHTDAALAAARRALELAPNWPVAQIETALLLARQPQHADEALALARQALASEPDNVQVRTGAINVAMYASQPEQTIAWADEGVQHFPNDAGMRLFLGRFLANQGRHAEALTHFEHMLLRVPHHAEALQGALTSTLAKDGPSNLAQDYADRWLALTPADANAQYWHAVAYGNTPATQPPDMVGQTFARFAPQFDKHLVSGLKYRVPERTAQILLDKYPDRQFNLLDLGCGTGLVGVYLGSIKGAIIGVDLSQPMIDEAAKHGIYAKFYRTNVLDALRETPDAHYEAITCTDVLIYVGDLTPVIPNALRILKPGGHFIFSCEAAAENEADLVLRSPSNRYAHKASAAQRLCREAGFDEVVVEDLPALRMEGGAPVAGFLVTAHKPLTV